MNLEKLPEFDVMRAFAIMIILVHHLADYTFNYYNLKYLGLRIDFSYMNELNRYLGVGTFVYISGSLQAYSYPLLNDFQSIMRFMVRKLIRMMPLYIVALVLFILIYGPVSLTSLIIHIFGLQIILSSKYCSPILTLWYVGLIMAYYFIYVALKKYENRNKFLIIVTILILSMIVRISTNFVDKRFFIYFPVFLAGVYSAHYFAKIGNGIRNIIFAITVMLVAIYIFAFHLYPLFSTDFRPQLLSFNSLEALILFNVIMVSFCFIAYSISKKMKVMLKYFNIIGFSSYCIYLFHRPIWWGMLKVYHPDDAMIRGIYLGIFGIPLLVAISYWIQKAYNELVFYIETHALGLRGY